MARFDPEHARIVVRLIYDGPAWAGKTTTLRALARILGADVVSGEEAEGRTLHFDWVDYVGGLYEGRPIHCQIVGVPGQRVLERRRRMLLETADAVVFVADSRPGQQAENAHAFALLRQVTMAASPPVAAVVQVNKRDLPGAVELDALRARLDAGANVAMTESVAERGEGIRETFVLAVRLALDRVRASGGGASLPEGSAADDARRELDALRAAAARRLGDRPAPPPPAAAAAPTPASSETDAPRESAPPVEPRRGPRPPDASLPSGFVWPPVAGRVTLHEAAREALVLERLANGDWCASSRTWRLRSSVEALYFDVEAGRHALIAWARWHTAAGARLSSGRAIALSEAAPGAWRLWQIVRYVRTLRDGLRELPALSDDAVGERLLRTLDIRLLAERELVAGGWLAQVDLRSIGLSELGEPLFTGLVPTAVAAPAEATPADERRVLEEEIGPALQEELALSPARLPGVLAATRRAAAIRGFPHVADILDRVLLGG